MSGMQFVRVSTEKLQSLLAQILSEPPLISTNTEPSPPTFFDEEPAPPTLSNQTNNVDPAAATSAVDPPPHAQSAVRRAEQANAMPTRPDPAYPIHLRFQLRR